MTEIYEPKEGDEVEFHPAGTGERLEAAKREAQAFKRLKERAEQAEAALREIERLAMTDEHGYFQFLDIARAALSDAEKPSRRRDNPDSPWTVLDRPNRNRLSGS